MADVEVISAPLATALASGRDRYNALFNQARLQNPGLDPGQFHNHLVRTIDPIITAVAAIDPAKVTPVLDKLYGLSLSVWQKKVFGGEAKYPAVETAYALIGSSLPHLLVQDTARFASAVINALCRLETDTAGRESEWVAHVLRCGKSFATVDEFINAGIVLAWLSGMVHYRTQALILLQAMDEDVRGLMFGLDYLSVSQLAKLTNDPWFDPRCPVKRAAKELIHLVRTTPGFRGFGGPFLTPPKLRAAGERLFARDRDNNFELHADAFGTSLRRVSEWPNENTSGKFAVTRSGKIMTSTMTESFPRFRDSLSSASTDRTLAITLPHSHHIYLFAVTSRA